MIHRVRVSRVLPDLTVEQVFAFRVNTNDQREAEALGHRLQTRWMELNPGHATVMNLDWPTADELGDKHVMPPMPTYFVWKNR